MKRTFVVLTLLGLALLTVLVVSFGVGAVTGAVAAAGWAGIAATCLAHLPSYLLCGLAWRALVRDTPMGPLDATAIRWTRESAGTLLPVPLVAEFVGGRMLVLSGATGALAAASMIVDVTMEALSQAAFTIAGLIAMAVRGLSPSLALWTLAGLCICVPALIVFLFAQRSSLFQRIEALAGRLALRWNRPEWAGTGLKDAIQAIHAGRGGLLTCFLLHLAAWASGLVETGVTLLLMGHPLAIVDLLVLESLVAAVRSVAFFIPGALGVQEGAFLVVGAMVGLPGEAALALALIKRTREIILGVPGLLVWQWREGRTSARKWMPGRHLS